MLSKEKILNTLPHYYGTERYHKLTMFGDLVATDGVAFVAESCEAYWLIDTISIAQSNEETIKEPFQVWKLSVKDSSATLVMEDGNGNLMYKDEIENTDFPLDEIVIWVSNGVMMLPSEY